MNGLVLQKKVEGVWRDAEVLERMTEEDLGSARPPDIFSAIIEAFAKQWINLEPPVVRSDYRLMATRSVRMSMDIQAMRSPHVLIELPTTGDDDSLMNTGFFSGVPILLVEDEGEFE